MKKNKVYLVFYGHYGDCSVSKVCSSYEAADAWRNKMANYDKFFIEEHDVDDVIPDKVTYNVWVHNYNKPECMTYQVLGNEVLVYSDECLIGKVIKMSGYNPCLRIVLSCESPDEAEKEAKRIVDMMYADKEKFSDFFDEKVDAAIYDVNKDEFRKE